MRSGWLSLRVLLSALAVTLAACSKGSPAAPTGPPVSTNSIVITAAGASPRSVQIAVGSRLLMTNNDSRPHNMTSDPHPEHDECLELNQIGYLLPGQSRESGNMIDIRTCGFHDHDLPGIDNLHGQILIH